MTENLDGGNGTGASKASHLLPLTLDSRGYSQLGVFFFHPCIIELKALK